MRQWLIRYGTNYASPTPVNSSVPTPASERATAARKKGATFTPSNSTSSSGQVMTEREQMKPALPAVTLWSANAWPI